MPVTFEELDDIAQRIKILTDKLRQELKVLYPEGKPDWMPEEQWKEIGGEG